MTPAHRAARAAVLAAAAAGALRLGEVRAGDGPASTRGDATCAGPVVHHQRRVDPVFLPALDAPLGVRDCEAAVRVQNVGDRPGRVMLWLWGAPGACFTGCRPPLAVLCTGLVAPGAAWEFEASAAGWPAGVQSGAVFSLAADAPAACLDLVRPAANGAGRDAAAGALPGCGAYRIFRTAWDDGADGGGRIALADVYGPPITASVTRRCPGANKLVAGIGAYEGVAGRHTAGYDRVAWVGTYAAPVVRAEPGAVDTWLSLQNAGGCCAAVDIWFQARDACQPDALCFSGTIPPGGTLRFRAADCRPTFDGTAWIRGSEPLAIVVDVVGSAMPDDGEALEASPALDAGAVPDEGAVPRASEMSTAMRTATRRYRGVAAEAGAGRRAEVADARDSGRLDPVPASNASSASATVPPPEPSAGLASYVAPPADLRAAFDAPPVFTAGGPRLVGPWLRGGPGIRSRWTVQNMASDRPAHVRWTVRAAGQAIVESAEICPRGSASWSSDDVTRRIGPDRPWTGDLVVESLPGPRAWEAPPNLVGVVEVAAAPGPPAGRTAPPVDPSDSGGVVGALAYEMTLVPGHRPPKASARLVGVARLGGAGWAAGGTPDSLVVADLGGGVGGTAFGLFAYDANGLAAVRCHRLPPFGAVALDTSRLGPVGRSFRGSALVSAAAWDPAVGDARPAAAAGSLAVLALAAPSASRERGALDDAWSAAAGFPLGDGAPAAAAIAALGPLACAASPPWGMVRLWLPVLGRGW